MRFLRKKNLNKLILVLSDLHLGGGYFIDGQRNHLEDFHFDKELVEFFTFYSTKDYESVEVELIINGDFLDLLAIPFVNFFDDEFWSEEASLEKLKIIIDAHNEVFQAMDTFLAQKNKKIVYIVGNHDAEILHAKLQEYLISQFKEKNRERFSIWTSGETYRPYEGIAIKHGHEYEMAHNFSPVNSIITTPKGKKFFVPPWGSYYVLKIVNRFKVDRPQAHSIRPIRTFIIYGLIFDTFWTLRFLLANCVYGVLVIFLYYFKMLGLVEAIKKSWRELRLFQDFEEILEEYFEENPQDDVIIVGHTHTPFYQSFANGKMAINTGTWTKMFNLDFSKYQAGVKLTYAQIEIRTNKNNCLSKEVNLNMWKGKSDLPYDDFH